MTLEFEGIVLDRSEDRIHLENIEVSDGTVGWNVIGSSEGKLLGDIIRLTRVRPGGRPRFSYYGKRASRFFGEEFRTKTQAVDYVIGSS